MKVVDAMEEEMVKVDVNVPVAKAVMRMCGKKTGCAIILKDGLPIGMLTERDVTCKIVGKCLDPIGVKVSEVMSKPLVIIDPEADLIEAAKLMENHKIRRLVVAKKGIVYGMLSATHIARNLEGYVEEEIRKILRYAFFPHS